MPQSALVDSPGEKGLIPAISGEGLSHATVVLGTPGNSRVSLSYIREGGEWCVIRLRQTD